MSRATIEKLAAVGLQVRPATIGKALVLVVSVAPGFLQERVVR